MSAAGLVPMPTHGPRRRSQPRSEVDGSASRLAVLERDIDGMMAGIQARLRCAT
jgi:hypothetical protein